ncbi:hypothetical protein [Variovorax ginsengisoli]|uniref:Apolipoprotein N-acyltransferase n=1 Tax=Variovorax ginsengisoli TaxID=363844 RepID=A0ABT9SE17_9BURK|nr:hypothetical protein [Variovorax ginsengisoli]MDP9902603.1 apolipoprotein N-acyltransferase [Variovorax ginsengisoli]
MQRTINGLLFAWLACYSALCWANNTLAQDLIAYDWMSLAFAAAAGLLGGAARTIFTLVSERALVGNVRTLLLKDLVVALIGGAAMYLAIQGYNSWASAIPYITLPPIARDLRVLLIVGAGFSRGRWFGVLDRLASDAIANASGKLRGSAAPDAPPSVAAPQLDK